MAVVAAVREYHFTQSARPGWTQWTRHRAHGDNRPSPTKQQQPRTCDLLIIAEAAQVPLQASRPDLTTMSYKSVIWPLQNLLG